MRREHDRMLASAMRGDIGWHRRVIVEQLLTLRCTQCQRPFAEYGDGECIALTCANAECKSRFCGWCLQAFGFDVAAGAAAHDHAAKCRLSASGSNIFPTKAQFVECHRKRRTQLVQDYISTKLPSTIDKKQLLELCKTELSQINITIKL